MHRNPSQISRLGICLLFAAMGLLAACGGGGSSAAVDVPTGDDPPVVPNPNPDPGDPPAEPPPGGPPAEEVLSYAPFSALDAEGREVELRWTYVLNGGEPISVDCEGFVGEATFDPFEVFCLPDSPQRISHMSFLYTGTVGYHPEPVSGAGVVDISDELDLSGDCAKILDRHAVLSFDGITADELGTVRLTSVVHVGSPVDWLPDRDDFGELPVPSVMQELEIFETLVDGLTHESSSAGHSDDRPFFALVETSQAWRILERLESMEVLGVTFEDVIAVELTTIVPDLCRPSEATEETARQTTRMWFARGVGLIKAENLFRFLGQPLDVELSSFERLDSAVQGE